MCQNACLGRSVPSPDAALGDGDGAARHPYQEQCQDAHVPGADPPAGLTFHQQKAFTEDMSSAIQLTPAQLRKAASLKEKIATLEKELAAIFNTSAPAAKPAKKKGKMSAAGRARIAAAQKARWAKIKAAKK
jgi:hypothetical protein